MGMFDYVKCDAPLPDGKPTPPDLFQTKDLSDPYLEHYTITAAGRLVANRVRYELVPLAERPYPAPKDYGHLLGAMRSVPIGDEDLNYHGCLNFYGGVGDEWREFNAKFTDGQLVEIVAAPKRPGRVGENSG